MGRNFRTEGVILKTYRVAEYHKGLVIISPDAGVLHATAFGAFKGKSKLSGVSEPFTAGDFLLYHDPVKDRYKVSEIVPGSYNEALRSELDRYYTALFWSELIIKSFGGGSEYGQLYYLLVSALDFLGYTHYVDRANLQFVWRYLDITGFLPDLSVCAACGREIGDAEVLYWQNGEFVGEECRLITAGDPELHRLSPAARKYLLHTGRLRPVQTEGVSLSSGELRTLKQLLYAIIEDVVGFRLNTIQKGVV
jgi:DNA repair protein RecO (recombination protein O)